MRHTSIQIMELVILNVVTLKMWKRPWDETDCMESNYKPRACPPWQAPISLWDL